MATACSPVRSPALALSLVVARDLAEPTVLDDAARRAILADAVAYARREPDGAATPACAAGPTPLRTPPTCSSSWPRAQLHRRRPRQHPRRGGRPGGAAPRRDFYYGEDGRLAKPVLEARRGISPAAIDAWLQVIAAPLGEPALAEFEPGQYAAQRNAQPAVHAVRAARARPGPGRPGRLPARQAARAARRLEESDPVSWAPAKAGLAQASSTRGTVIARVEGVGKVRRSSNSAGSIGPPARSQPSRASRGLRSAQRGARGRRRPVDDPDTRLRRAPSSRRPAVGLEEAQALTELAGIGSPIPD